MNRHAITLALVLAASHAASAAPVAEPAPAEPELEVEIVPNARREAGAASAQTGAAHHESVASDEEAPPEVRLAPPMPDRSVPAAAEEPPVPELRSPIVAGLLSTGVTLAGLAMLLSVSEYPEDETLGFAGAIMMTIGPTTGHAYAGSVWNPGLKWRLIGLGTAVTGAALVVAGCPPLSQCTEGGEGLATVGALALTAGAVTYAGAFIYEIATAPRSARAYNRKHAQAQVSVAPMLGQASGLAVVGRF